MSPGEIELRALTDVWTGGVGQDGKHFYDTGLIGSLRWWYEALVRGLGGGACDPATDGHRCPDDDGRHCPACELFGCTGWGRKFRMEVRGTDGALQEKGIKKGGALTLVFHPLRPICAEEWWLLEKAIWLAATYGAVGGKTTLKPQVNEVVGADYGLMQYVQTSIVADVSREEVENYLRSGRWGQKRVALPDLRWFFFIQGGYLKRNEINRLLGLGGQSGTAPSATRPYQVFIRGRKSSDGEGAESKKVFSFAHGKGRLWGYGEGGAMRDEIMAEIAGLLPVTGCVAKTGEEVLDEL